MKKKQTCWKPGILVFNTISLLLIVFISCNWLLQFLVYKSETNMILLWISKKYYMFSNNSYVANNTFFIWSIIHLLNISVILLLQICYFLRWQKHNFINCCFVLFVVFLAIIIIVFWLFFLLFFVRLFFKFYQKFGLKNIFLIFSLPISLFFMLIILTIFNLKKITILNSVKKETVLIDNSKSVSNYHFLKTKERENINHILAETSNQPEKKQASIARLKFLDAKIKNNSDSDVIDVNKNDDISELNHKLTANFTIYHETFDGKIILAPEAKMLTTNDTTQNTNLIVDDQIKTTTKIDIEPLSNELANEDVKNAPTFYLWTEEEIKKVWEKAFIVEGYDPTLYRKDYAGAWMFFHSFINNIHSNENLDNRQTYKWTIILQRPENKGGRREIPNLDPINIINAKSKSDNYPTWKTEISSSSNQNVEKKQYWKAKI